jgi:ABC-type multidrug transport system ATPase subunit
MVRLLAENLSKKFKNDWIFRDFQFEFRGGRHYAITGPNGSGKSTLLQVLAGVVPPTQGTVVLELAGKSIDIEELHSKIALAAPALDLLGEFTLQEFLLFHFRFRLLRNGISLSELPELLQLAHARNKELKNFSSGMLQRVKLGIALFAEVPVVLLDEPATNLDEAGLAWYLSAVNTLKEEAVVLVASNNPQEYTFCEEEIHIPDYK